MTLSWSTGDGVRKDVPDIWIRYSKIFVVDGLSEYYEGVFR